MKKLSDYKGEDAIELWAELIDPLTVILSDPKIKKAMDSGKTKLDIAKVVLKLHKKEALEILQKIDPAPVDGLNVVFRLVALLADIGQNEEITSFFGYAGQVKTDSASSGSATVNIEAEEK